MLAKGKVSSQYSEKIKDKVTFSIAATHIHIYSIGRKLMIELNN